MSGGTSDGDSDVICTDWCGTTMQLAVHSWCNDGQAGAGMN